MLAPRNRFSTRSAQKAFRPISEMIREIWADMPEEVRARLAAEGANEHDPLRPAVFADSFYRIALTNPSDAAYHDARTFDRSPIGMRILTTDEVVIEFLTTFGSGSV